MRRIPTLATLNKAATALSGATIRSLDFHVALEDVKPRDLVFLDPPYTVSHNDNGFIKYNQHLFSASRIRSALLRPSGMSRLLVPTTFSPMPRTRRLRTSSISADCEMTVHRGNTISSQAASRGSTSEYLFTNLDEGKRA